ncbi:hypothetical protein SBA5_290175 [Candidatus Sulfotelmatomonas gaucii]|uniref:Uncharacterized protein n=1 Tax=Candidatus Sulfuritelmatomonas gaucii TaxID=2043161 RepID=A0A2N9LAQ2_9BACT|nr:hypothetical protein SBA5_290175 [Candidatus Sulfotelmatomonas gaucii]
MAASLLCRVRRTTAKARDCEGAGGGGGRAELAGFAELAELVRYGIKPPEFIDRAESSGRERGPANFARVVAQKFMT